MGDFTLGASGNASIGLTSVDYNPTTSVNSTKAAGSTSSILYSTGGGTTPTSVESQLLSSPPRSAMQDAVGDQSQQSQQQPGGGAGGSAPVDDGPQMPPNAGMPPGSIDSKKVQDHMGDTTLGNGLIDKLSEPPNMKPVGMGTGFDTNTSALWSNATCGIDDATSYLQQHGGMNGGGGGGGGGGGLPYQNYVSFNSGRRAITATHNFRQQQQQQQQQQQAAQQPQVQYKQQQQPSAPQAGYGWATPGSQQQPPGTWSSGASAPWNRGRSVPNLNPMQGSIVNRKPSPTGFGQPTNMLISPVKFRRSTSYPGKGMFGAQPPTFEITNMDDARDLLPYQVVCRVD